jgi:hypothetical protein
LDDVSDSIDDAASRHRCDETDVLIVQQFDTDQEKIVSQNVETALTHAVSSLPAGLSHVLPFILDNYLISPSPHLKAASHRGSWIHAIATR